MFYPCFVMKKTLAELIAESEALKSKMAGYEGEIEYLREMNLKAFNSWNLIELEIIFGKRYTKQLSFFEIEKHLFNNYKLIAIDKATNIIDNNAYSVNCLYLRNNIE